MLLIRADGLAPEQMRASYLAKGRMLHTLSASSGAERCARPEFQGGQEPEIFQQDLKPALRAQRSQLWVNREPVRVSPAARDCLLQIIECGLRLAQPCVSGAGGVIQLPDKAFPNPRLRSA